MEDNPTFGPLEVREYKTSQARRRELLPWWIQGFTLFFLFIGLSLPFIVVSGIMGHKFYASLYGFEKADPISLLGIFLIFLYLIKAITAFGLWTEKKWAVDLGIYDAIIGLIVCFIAMLVLPLVDTSEGFVFKFRLEPILLILYLLKLQKIKPLWKDL